MSDPPRRLKGRSVLDDATADQIRHLAVGSHLLEARIRQAILGQLLAKAKRWSGLRRSWIWPRPSPGRLTPVRLMADRACRLGGHRVDSRGLGLPLTGSWR
jgi:hypothetical protein